MVGAMGKSVAVPNYATSVQRYFWDMAVAEKNSRKIHKNLIFFLPLADFHAMRAACLRPFPGPGFPSKPLDRNGAPSKSGAT